MTDATPERISAYLFGFAERWPDREFLIAGDRRVSYGEAGQQVRAISRAMLAAGVQPGDRVATFAHPSPEFALTFLAAVDIGAVWVGLNPKYTRHELQHVVRDSRPTLIFGVLDHDGPTGPDDLANAYGAEHTPSVVTLGGTLPGVLDLRGFLARAADVMDDSLDRARAGVQAEQAALIVYTSGTTGSPKGAVLSHKSLIWSFSRQGERWGGESIRTILNLPINHSGAVGDVFSSVLAVGGTLVLMERFDPDAMLDVIPRERINTLMQIPTMYQILTARPGFANADLSTLRCVVWGGAAMPAPVLAKLTAPGRVLGVVYGQSEAPASITFSSPDASVEQLTTTLGRPDPAMEVRLVDEGGSLCPAGVPGEIQVRHSSIFLGYFGNPEASREAFTDDGFLKTGDRAIERADGYLQMVGRMKEMFKSGGYNVYPREIELCLESHPDLAMAIVVSRPDEVFDEVGHAFVVPRTTAEASADALTSWCRERLANYKIPKGFTVTSAVPMLPIGKPDRRALRNTAIEIHEQSKASLRTENV